jgi:hypothetical protein
VVFQNTSAYQSLAIGTAFVNLNPGSPEHLWVVIALTSIPEAVIFNATTKQDDSDTTCVLQPGDHPFIIHESIIAYGRGQLITEPIFAALQRAGCSLKQKASDELVVRIREGAIKSNFTSPKLQAIILQNPLS